MFRVNSGMIGSKRYEKCSPLLKATTARRSRCRRTRVNISVTWILPASSLPLPTVHPLSGWNRCAYPSQLCASISLSLSLHDARQLLDDQPRKTGDAWSRVSACLLLLGSWETHEACCKFSFWGKESVWMSEIQKRKYRDLEAKV